MNQYLFVLRAALERVRVASWHQLTTNEAETKAVMFGMTISSQMNMGSGILKIQSKEEWTPELLESYVNSLSLAKRAEFIKESKLAD